MSIFEAKQVSGLWGTNSALRGGGGRTGGGQVAPARPGRIAGLSLGGAGAKLRRVNHIAL